MIGGIIIGFFLGSGSVLGIGVFALRKNEKDTKGRRGLIRYSYTSRDSYGITKGKYIATYEVIEVERTDVKSKVKVLDVKSSDPSANQSGSDRTYLISYMNNTWQESSEIEWIQKPIDEQRDEKLNELLK
jgi:hypothetical protein